MRHTSPCLFLSALFALNGCGADPDDSGLPAAYQPPDRVGPWSVGATTGATTGRDGVALPLTVWYPAEEGDAPLFDYGPLGTGAALDGATPDCASLRPVALFSHASGWFGQQSFFLAERLASHGWVVIAPDHTGNTREDQDANTLGATLMRRPRDLADALDAVLGGAAGDGIAACLDGTETYSVIGHDVGGESALLAAGAPVDLDALATRCAAHEELACAAHDAWTAGGSAADLSDPRVRAAVVIAPSLKLSTASAIAAITAPTLVIGGTEDSAVDWDLVLWPLYEGLTATPRAAAAVEGAGHLSFTNLCTGWDTWPECGLGYRQPGEVQRITDVLAVPFLELARGEDRAAAYLPPPEEEALFFTWVP